CGGDSSRIGTQLIEIIDTTAPIFVCPQDFTVSSDEDCEMLVDFPPVNATDGCSNGIIVQIDPEGSPLVNSNGGQSMLQSGVNLVTYTVRDSCHNSASCQVSVTVQDQVEPVAICESNTTVGLTSSGSTFVNAITFDDGSWDGCGIDRFEVRRMTTDCNQDDLTFGDQVEFCCTDAGSEVMVVFRVFDTSGNTNDCMVRVEVQDKIPATLECPLNVNIDCRDAFDVDNLSVTFGEAKVIGNCSTPDMVSEESILDINQCNIGTITRTFSISDNDNNTVDPSCIQIINISNTAPFNESMIQWPSDFVSTSGVCTVDEVNPEDLDPQFAFPIFTGGDDQCSMLGFSFEDNLISTNVAGQCFMIERTWTVINWCDDTGNTFAQFTDPDGPQIIEVRNTDGPMTDSFDPITVESQNIDCTSGLIEYTRTGTSSCVEPLPLNWSYVVNDLGGNQMAAGDTNVFSQVLVAAQYNVVWTISDQCNNTIVQNQALTVVNTKAPTPVCMTNLIFALNTPVDTNGDGMNDGGSIELWASDFDGGSFHTCNNPISISISPDPADTNITFTCDSLGVRTLRLYVTDNNTMAQDFCSFTIEITDGGMCGDGRRAVVEGDIYTEDYQSVEDVEVNLVNGNTMNMTNEEGHYAFNDMPLGGDYLVSPSKDINYLNGVSTLDLVYIQRHILNIEKLDSPYKLLAADANDSHSVTALDLIELRKLILGVRDELPDNNSWRFIDVEHDFIDEFDPWLQSMPEDFLINNLEGDVSVDFIGVKIGDVNGTVITNLQSQVIESRANRWPLSFIISEQNINQGPAAVSFYSDSYERISGWQMTLEFDPENITVSNIESDVLDINSYHYYIDAQDKGWITISYNSDRPIDVDPNQEVFRIEFDTKKSMRSSDIFEVTSKITPAESYRGLNEIVDINLRVQQDKVSLLSIESASPNPWSDHTDITFEINEQGPCTWHIYNVRGQMVYSTNKNYRAGTHQLRIDRSHIPHGGVYYLKLIAKSGSAEYKLMVID
ncbi:T9SS type A sorting domain-containing protein, partial [Saprospiraceae bacterium]|nr:T9SS type A sorting domain-containing protein [Saprospiraceae bacterium]